MAWDSSRPVPWKRLVREWAIYVAIMAAVFAALFRDRPLGGLMLGLAISGPLFVLLSAAMAKLGYTRPTLKERRAQASAARAMRDAEAGSAQPAAASRPRPAPTKRTGGGTGRPGGSRRR